MDTYSYGYSWTRDCGFAKMWSRASWSRISRELYYSCGITLFR